MKEFTFDTPVNSGKDNYGFLRVTGCHSDALGTWINAVEFHNGFQWIDVTALLQISAPELYTRIEAIAKEHVYKVLCHEFEKATA